MSRRRSIAIVQRRLTHYRVPLFDLLRQLLAAQGVDLRLLHGEPTPAERLKDDAGHLAWAEPLPTRYGAGGALCWQPFAARCRGSDLVVITQENKLANNLLPLLNPWRRQRLAFWGHGADPRNAASLAGRFKRWTTRRVDWWFAYTDASAERIEQCGFDRDRITVLNNSIDTAALRSDLQRANSLPRQSLRQSFGLGDGPVAVFIGSLYAEKRIDWLFGAAQRLRRQIGGFQLVIAGAGTEQPAVIAASSPGGPVTWVGSVNDRRKAELLACADVMLCPGAVGLSVLDSLVAGVPMITTAGASHGPEIDYLSNGVNGLITDDDPTAFADACARLLHDAAELARLQVGALASGRLYSIEQMADRFCTGLLAAAATTTGKAL